MGKEFLKLENKLVLDLEIEPLSPLIIKLGDGSEENSKNEKSESVISFVTSDSPRGNLVEYDKNKNVLIIKLPEISTTSTLEVEVKNLGYILHKSIQNKVFDILNKAQIEFDL